MNTNIINVRKVILLLLVVFSLSFPGRQVQAASESPDYRSHCNAKSSLVYRTILKRIDFGWSDGKGHGYGLPDGFMASDNRFQAMDIHRLDFGWSDGKGNGQGLPDGIDDTENIWQPMDARRLDFGWSDGRGIGYGLPDGSTVLINNVLTMVCS